MPANVNTPVILVGSAQHGLLELVDRGALADQRSCEVSSSCSSRELVDVSSEAARVGSKTIGTWILGNICENRADGPKADGHATRLLASSAF